MTQSSPPGAPLIRILRFSDLKEARIAENWPTLRRLQADHGFPTGWLISANRRVWDADDVERWIEERRTRSSRRSAA
jgi:hypothetical protein